MEKSSKKSSVIKIVMSIVVLAVLIGCGVLAGILINKKNNTATGTVEMDLNPSAQFVVNADNKVLSVNYLNDDANTVYANIEVVGKSIDEVAYQFTLNAIKSGKGVDVNMTSGTGNTVSISINCANSEQAEALKNKMNAKINSAFDENGIFGKAVSTINAETTNLVEKYDKIADKLHIQASEFADKTETEILAMIKEESARYEGLTAEQLSAIKDDTKKTAVDAIEKTIDSLNASIEKAQTAIEQAQQDIKTYQKAVNDAQKEVDKIEDKTSVAYTSAQLVLTSAKATLEIGNTALETAKTQLETLKTQLKDAKAELKQDIEELDAHIDQLAKEGKSKVAQFKTDLQTLINDYKSVYDAHKSAFENKTQDEKQAVLDAIAEWRNA